MAPLTFFFPAGGQTGIFQKKKRRTRSPCSFLLESQTVAPNEAPQIGFSLWSSRVRVESCVGTILPKRFGTEPQSPCEESLRERKAFCPGRLRQASFRGWERAYMQPAATQSQRHGDGTESPSSSSSLPSPPCTLRVYSFFGRSALACNFSFLP